LCSQTSGKDQKSVELHDKVIGHYLNIKHYQ
ncbi:IS1 family transposase, partial [Escherichia coli]